MRPQIYYHLWQAPGWQLWRMLFAEQMMGLEDSGLADAADLHLCVTGTDADIAELSQPSVLGLYPWVKSFNPSPIEPNQYEGTTLHRLWQDAQSLHPDTPILYMHGKGSLTMNRCVYHWLKLMEWFCVYRWQDCLDLLQSCDAVGVNLYDSPRLHFAGNFWWARAGYVVSLRSPLDSGYYVDDTRIKYEMWICSGEGEFRSLHQTNLNHYIDPYPPSRYR